MPAATRLLDAPRSPVLSGSVPTPVITVRQIGVEAQPLAIIDDFAADPDALRAAAVATPFAPAAHHYPGLRAPLPDSYWRDQAPVIELALARMLGAAGPIQLIDASFSMVTRSPAALTRAQRLPHCDAHARERIAMVHYLSLDDPDGTAFFRHRSTGFESVDEERSATYDARLATELRGVRLPGYVAADTPLFERVALVGARYNRAVLYRSFLLHSGAISPDAPLSTDPAHGRLTVTAFLAVAH